MQDVVEKPPENSSKITSILYCVVLLLAIATGVAKLTEYLERMNKSTDAIINSQHLQPTTNTEISHTTILNSETKNLPPIVDSQNISANSEYWTLKLYVVEKDTLNIKSITVHYVTEGKEDTQTQNLAADKKATPYIFILPKKISSLKFVADPNLILHAYSYRDEKREGKITSLHETSKDYGVPLQTYCFDIKEIQTCLGW